jgi:glycosyltransferase involved in cell wall biosynthesis
LRIAFDGTVLHGHKSGVGYYCEELLKAMLAVDHEDQFHVFSHQPLDLSIVPANGNLKFTNTYRFPIRAFYMHALLPRILDELQPDLCHYTNFLAPISESRPYVVTIHDMGLEVLRHAHPVAKRLYTRRLVPRVARRARLIITNSEYSKWEIVRHLGISEDRIRVTPLAASREFVPTASGRRSGNPYFLYVGNLEPRKNLSRLIEAFAQIPQTEHQLIIVGDRWYQAGDAEEKARSLGLNGRVKFMGYVPRSELPALFSNATAFVYPSLLEGFGLPIVEAMACGAPVITSNNSSMKEVAGNAAMLVDPRDVKEIAEALANMAGDAALRRDLSKKGLARAAQFSWNQTARLTLNVYREAAGLKHVVTRFRTQPQEVVGAIDRTVEYAKFFQYPLRADELRERLFDVEVDAATFREVLHSLHYRPDPELLAIRAEREKISDRAIQQAAPHLKALASIPFVRMIAFSGSTAHRNMTSGDDLDLFLIVEEGKVWAVFFAAILWAKLKGLRKHLCLNYLIGDKVLPLFDHDVFTAQQVASLKPLYGKPVYDRFLEANPFVKRCFPNFDSTRHRAAYPEIESPKVKRFLEMLLKFGPIQIFERFSRFALGRYLAKQVNAESDVLLDRSRLKLHMQSHKQRILSSVIGRKQLAKRAVQS